MRKYTSQENQKGGVDNMEDRQPCAKIGDIIQIRGYGNRKYEVFSVQYTKDVYPSEMFVDICYDTVSLDGSDFILAFQEDITVVNTPENVDYKRLEYLAEKSIEPFGDIFGGIFGGGFEIVASDDQFEKEGEEMPEEKTESIDDLLDELNDYKALIELFGEDYEDGDGYYKRKADECMTKLAKMTEK